MNRIYYYLNQNAPAVSISNLAGPSCILKTSQYPAPTITLDNTLLTS